MASFPPELPEPVGFPADPAQPVSRVSAPTPTTAASARILYMTLILSKRRWRVKFRIRPVSTTAAKEQWRGVGPTGLVRPRHPFVVPLFWSFAPARRGEAAP